MWQWVRNIARRNRAATVMKRARFMVDPGKPSADDLRLKAGFVWAHDSYRDGYITLHQLKQRVQGIKGPWEDGVRKFVSDLEALIHDLENL